MDLVGHITMQHGNLFKVHRRRRARRGSSESQSTLSLLRKELHDGNLQFLLEGSSYTVPPSNAAADPLLSSFITNLAVPEISKVVQPDEQDAVNTGLHEKVKESLEPALSEKDKEERTRRCGFVQGLVLSTIFDDDFL